MHGESGTGHTQFASIWQSELQPSPDTVLPSSHCSPMSSSTTPSPQNSIFWHGCPGLGQVHPGSRAQVEEQPSPETVLPSSHCSLPATWPSPHTFVGFFTHGPPLPLTSGHV